MSKTDLGASQKKFLTSERVAHLATINATDKSPHVVPICFAFDGKTLVATLNARSKRLKNVEQGSKVAFLVDRYEEEKGEWKVLRGLLIYGKIEILSFQDNRDEFMYSWKLLIEKYPQYKQWANADFKPKDPERRRIMKMEIEKIVQWGFE